MVYRTQNAEGIPLQTLSVEMPVDLYRALRIAAAEQNMCIAKFVRAMVRDFLAERCAEKQSVADGYSAGGSDQSVIYQQEIVR
jgi:hypothetical protein